MSVGPVGRLITVERLRRSMPETELLGSECVQDRAEIATFLRQIADKLEADGSMTLRAGDQSVTVEPPDRPTFEVEVEREGPADAPGEMSVEFEIEWDERDDVSIE
jgi:amphi-Trp domain-containing protein